MTKAMQAKLLGVSRFGRLDLGIWFEVTPIRKHGLDHVAVGLYVGDPAGDHAKLDSSVFNDVPLARKWGDRQIRRMVDLTDACADVPPTAYEEVL